MRAVVVVAEFYPEITEKMLASCMKELESAVRDTDNELEREIQVIRVPGAAEIPFALRVVASQSVNSDKLVSPVLAVALGCVIRGETYHFNIISETCAYGIMDVQLHYGVPIGNGVLTVENKEQALARVGKGGEAACAALALASIAEAHGTTWSW